MRDYGSHRERRQMEKTRWKLNPKIWSWTQGRGQHVGLTLWCLASGAETESPYRRSNKRLVELLELELYTSTLHPSSKRMAASLLTRQSDVGLSWDSKSSQGCSCGRKMSRSDIALSFFPLLTEKKSGQKN